MSRQAPPQQQQPQQQQRPPQERTMQAGVRGGLTPQAGQGPYYSPAPAQETMGTPGELKVAGVGGGPWSHYMGPHQSRFNVAKLRESDGIIPLQYGTNRFASQKNMTGFGTPRDVNGKHLHRVWDDFFTDEAEPSYQQQQQQYYQ